MVLYRDRCKHISKKQSNSFIYHSESYEAGNALTRQFPDRSSRIPKEV